MIMTALVPVTPALPVPVPVSDAEQDTLRDLWARRKSDATYRAYANDWRGFQIFCHGIGEPPIPAEPKTVARYLAYLQTTPTRRGSAFASTTIARYLAGISHFHRERGATDPTKHPMVAGIMEGIRRTNAGKPTQQKGALLTKHLKKGLRGELKKPQDYRDRAMMLVAFAAAFRRSELIGMDVEHCTFDDEGRVCIRLLKSKTNQTGEREEIWILPTGSPTCPVKALKEWLRVSGVTSGAVWRSVDRHTNVKGRLSGEAVAYVTKRCAKRAGLNPSEFSAHSLRSGHVTVAFANETPIELIQQQTRHRDINSLMRYRRAQDAQTRNSSSHLGL